MTATTTTRRHAAPTPLVVSPRSLRGWAHAVEALGGTVPEELTRTLAAEAELDRLFGAQPDPGRVLESGLAGVDSPETAADLLQRIATAQASVSVAASVRQQVAHRTLAAAIDQLANGGLDEVLASLRAAAEPVFASHREFVQKVPVSASAADILASADPEAAAAWRAAGRVREWLERLVRVLAPVADFGILPPRTGVVATLETIASLVAPSAPAVRAIVRAIQPVRIDPLGAAMVGRAPDVEQPLGAWRQVPPLTVNGVDRAAQILRELDHGDASPDPMPDETTARSLPGGFQLIDGGEDIEDLGEAK